MADQAQVTSYSAHDVASRLGKPLVCPRPTPGKEDFIVDSKRNANLYDKYSRED